MYIKFMKTVRNYNQYKWGSGHEWGEKWSSKEGSENKNSLDKSTEPGINHDSNSMRFVNEVFSHRAQYFVHVVFQIFAVVWMNARIVKTRRIPQNNACAKKMRVKKLEYIRIKENVSGNQRAHPLKWGLLNFGSVNAKFYCNIIASMLPLCCHNIATNLRKNFLHYLRQRRIFASIITRPWDEMRKELHWIRLRYHTCSIVSPSVAHRLHQSPVIEKLILGSFLVTISTRRFLGEL